MDHTYWQKQTASKPLFPDIEWNKPERKNQAGKLLIVGGNKLGFAAVAENYQAAIDTGAGDVKVLVPDALKKTMPKTLTDILFAPTTMSGGLSKESLPELTAAASWSDGVLLIGDAGRNSETAILYEQFIPSHDGMLTVTRDAIDLVKNNPSMLIERDNTLIVASFAQLQKLFQGVYYPKMLTFNMQLLQLVEALHKFTITYPCTIMTLHKDTIVVAHNGDVVTQKWEQPMAIWRGNVATNAATYWLWHSNESLKSAVASLL